MKKYQQSTEPEDVIVKRFDRLFVYSQKCIFLCAYYNAKAQFESSLVNENGIIKRYFSFFRFRNCFGKHESLFRINELVFTKVEEERSEEEIRKLNLIQSEHLQVNLKLQEKTEKLDSSISNKENSPKNTLSIRRNNENKISSKRSSIDINEEPTKMRKNAK